MSDLLDHALTADWYHSIELPGGHITNGYVDLRPVAPRVLPDSLLGREVLDVGTMDGFWAFAMEQLGAEAVTALDVPGPEDLDLVPLARKRILAEAATEEVTNADRFRMAHELLGSRVRRIEGNAYSVTAKHVGGPKDFVFLGTILRHFRDPVGVLENLRNLLATDGILRVFETISVPLTLLYPRRAAARLRPATSTWDWSIPNIAGVREWILAAGYSTVSLERVLREPSKKRPREVMAVFTARP